MSVGVLYVVATPIGNLGDVSARAAQVLRDAAVVYAEDTRRTRVLLEHVGLAKDLRSLHEHNERERAGEVVEALVAGESLALVTDAGTPGVSDPGADVVAAALAAGARVSPIPGPSALAAALSVAGFAEAAHDVLFVGFLPVKGKERRAALARVHAHAGVVVLFEAPHRAAATLRELVELEPERAACLCRELTKLHEEVRRGSVGQLAERVAAGVLGEITLVLGPLVKPREVAGDAEVDLALSRCLEAGLTPRDAATAVAAVLQAPRRSVYARCQVLLRRAT